jgi:hypothetical protein
MVPPVLFPREGSQFFIGGAGARILAYRFKNIYLCVGIKAT